MEAWKHLLKGHPDDERIQHNLQNVMLQLAIQDTDRRNYDLAIEHWKDYLKLFDGKMIAEHAFAETMYRKGKSILLGRHDGNMMDAHKLILEALELRPDNMGWRGWLTVSLLRTQQIEEAANNLK